MQEQLTKKSEEFIENIKNHDKALLELIKLGHRKLVIKVIKDYLSLHE